jgi:hypothetical protein
VPFKRPIRPSDSFARASVVVGRCPSYLCLGGGGPMSKLPPYEPSVAVADAGRRKAAAQEALGAHTSAVSSAAGLGKASAVSIIPLPRRRIHLLGERPLAELFIGLATGDDLHGVLERYARLAPAADLIGALGGDRLPAPRAIKGERR